MRLHKALAAATLACLLASGCARMASRLTFIKPNPGRGDYTQVAPDYDVRETADDKRRVGLLDRLGLAGAALQRGDLGEAESQAREALKIDSKSADATTVLGLVAERRGQSDAAGGFYAKAEQLAPTSGVALNNYGAWLCRHGHAPEALARFDAALHDPAYAAPATALGNAGACALRAGQAARAEENLRRALQIDPANAAALGAMAQLRFNQGQYLDARAFMQRRLEAAPADRDGLLLAAQIEDRMGDAAAAARYRQRLSNSQAPQGNGDTNGALGQ
ncbi:MAG TPA: type IV pilus biogenesis/stability protein PilW [Lysobacter sp.]|nr:type IV pilus biogenesis/stability protein PilW [Lysobacter sp.]